MIRRNGKKATPPCPCGFLGHYSAQCRCTPDRIAHYRGRLSGPLLDRIDLHVEVPALPERELDQVPGGEPSAMVRTRVQAARERQLERQGHPNVVLASGELNRHCLLDAAARNLLRQAVSRHALSARGYDRTRRVARTIADLESSPMLRMEHVAEALQYRSRGSP